MHVSLTDSPKYEALSYTWGDPGWDIGAILLNDVRLPLASNLFTALIHLRSGAVESLLWIDAICIDQLDLAEKSAQIPRMKDVYQAASRVGIWLGPAGQISDMAMKLVEDIPSIDLDSIPIVIKDEGTMKAWDALLQLVRRDRWTRSWILQEIAVASSDPIIGSGKRWMPWTKFTNAWDLMSRSSSLRVLRTVSITKTALSTIWKKGNIGLPIRTLLQATYPFEAADPRDEICIPCLDWLTRLIGLPFVLTIRALLDRSTLRWQNTFHKTISISSVSTPIPLQLTNFLRGYQIGHSQISDGFSGYQDSIRPTASGKQRLKRPPVPAPLRFLAFFWTRLAMLTQQVGLIPPNPQNLINQDRT
jgi:Heterokaryon incompatibility protein (HET)